MNSLDKEASKHIILRDADIIDKLITRPEGDEEAYHHANFVLTQVMLALLAYIDDAKIHQAADTILEGHYLVAQWIDTRS